MTVEIRELSGIDELRELAELFAVVWGRAGDPPIGPDVLKALAHSGNYISGAYRDRRLVGGLAGWMGGAPGDLHLHSHILGVLQDRSAGGIGFELKQHQRRWCLHRGITVMEWTTDPLVRRNAYFNLTKLGARAPRYIVNFYGGMTDGINAGEESDRLLIRWTLDSHEAEAAASGGAEQVDVEALVDQGAAVALSVDARGRPSTALARSRATRVLCQVPEDIVALRGSDAALAHEWRMALRAALGDAMEGGMEIVAATRTGWYVLESRA